MTEIYKKNDRNGFVSDEGTSTGMMEEEKKKMCSNVCCLFFKMLDKIRFSFTFSCLWLDFVYFRGILHLI